MLFEAIADTDVATDLSLTAAVIRPSAFLSTPGAWIYRCMQRLPQNACIMLDIGRGLLFATQSPSVRNALLYASSPADAYARAVPDVGQRGVRLTWGFECSNWAANSLDGPRVEVESERKSAYTIAALIDKISAPCGDNGFVLVDQEQGLVDFLWDAVPDNRRATLDTALNANPPEIALSLQLPPGNEKWES
jgi:hypothetical protein